jgi:4a-hydroxytetrahydrobiopterin dehydratase
MGYHYSEEEVKPRLVFLPGWRFSSNGIQKEFEFRDFVTAFGFITKVAMEAEKADHHPEWSNVWNKVTIRLSTHDSGGVTDKDFQLAETIERHANK